MRRLLCALVALLALVVAAPAQSASKPLFSPPIHRGQTGKQVAAIQWLLQGNDPNAYRATIHPFRGHTITGQYGRQTARSVLTARWLLGYPLAYDKACGCRPAKLERFDRDLYLILTGRKARPLGFIGRASTRIAAVEKQRAAQAPACARRAVAIARRELTAGVHEEPPHSNWGIKGRPSEHIRWYQSVTGAYHAAWCASWLQAVYLWSGVGTVANRSAGVFYIASWGQRRGWIRARPVVGSEVLYMLNLGHTGIVVAVGRTTMTTIEGNSSDAVTMHVYPIGYNRSIFLVPPCMR